MTKIHDGLPELDFPTPAGIVYKSIDGQGNPTDIDTGSQDMFSEHNLEEDGVSPEIQQADTKLPRKLAPTDGLND